MAVLSPQLTRNVVQQVAYSPMAGNFNDYVKYARGAMGPGQAPNAAGFQQYMTGIYGQPPGGNKNQQQPAAPAGAVTEAGQLSRVPMPQAAAQPPSVAPSKSPKNLQYAAALSRMK